MIRCFLISAILSIVNNQILARDILPEPSPLPSKGHFRYKKVFTIGDRVYTDRGIKGIVVGVNDKDDILVRVNGIRRKYNVKHLALPKFCLKDICTETMAFTTANTEVIIEAIYNDKWFVVKTETDFYYKKQLSDLFFQFGCTKNKFCIGDRVESPYGRKGYIVAVSFANNVVKVEFDQSTILMTNTTSGLKKISK